MKAVRLLAEMYLIFGLLIILMIIIQPDINSAVRIAAAVIGVVALAALGIIRYVFKK